MSEKETRTQRNRDRQTDRRREKREEIGQTFWQTNGEIKWTESFISRVGSLKERSGRKKVAAPHVGKTASQTALAFKSNTTLTLISVHQPNF